MQLPPLGLYIHLPWCERKCPYCDFNSHETGEVPEEQYVHALLQDLRNDLPMMQGRSVETLFIGGGTPSLFSAKAIRDLMQGIANMLHLSPSLEATLEANPGSADADKFYGFKEAGINRLSIGIQSFDNAQLQTLGRIHTSDQAYAAIDFARQAGFDNFNLDLMHGLPAQTLHSAETDLLLAIACEPPHLSWYQLTIEPNTVFHQRPPQLPAEDALADIQQRGERLMANNGFSQYEVSAYSQAGFNCSHNSNYWSFGDYLGIGAGAHGKISFPDGRIERYNKRRQPQKYLSAAPQEFIASTRALRHDEIAGEFIMNALRLNQGFTLQQFRTRTGLESIKLEPELESLCQRGLLVLDKNTVRATDTGRCFLDTIIAEFFSD
ncbi:MAG: radical SAM family heme chaperone HemW [Halioglobus sp.]|nr:radical SAM family heme chaperone HemW [Halioglobus sp.]